MNVGPRYIGCEFDALITDVNAVNAERNCAKHVDQCEKHQADVTTGVQGCIGR